jgi:hypothetical protein
MSEEPWGTLMVAPLSTIKRHAVSCPNGLSSLPAGTAVIGIFFICQSCHGQRRNQPRLGLDLTRYGQIGFKL